MGTGALQDPSDIWAQIGLMLLLSAADEQLLLVTDAVPSQQEESRAVGCRGTRERTWSSPCAGMGAVPTAGYGRWDLLNHHLIITENT